MAAARHDKEVTAPSEVPGELAGGVAALFSLDRHRYKCIGHCGAGASGIR